MYLHQLRIFAAVAEIGNMTQAAKRLNLSQPAASAQIKSLEEELGVQLFERRRERLSLTNVGASLLPKVQKALAASGDLMALAKNLSGSITGQIKLACPPAALDKSFFPLADRLQFITTQHPGLDIDVHQRGSSDIWSGVKEGAFDIGLAFGHRDLLNVRSISLREIPYRIVASTTSTTWDSSVRHASWKEMQALPWVTCNFTNKHYDMAKQLFDRFGFQPGKMIKGNSEDVISGLVIAGMGLGLMREDLALAAQASGKIFIIDRGRPTTQFQMIYGADREADPAISAVLTALRFCPATTEKTAELTAS
jgi:DNA-binding transcriptional LysR family regulator